ncbi:hypothetical protein YC2023_031245 [Brassica napus]
MRKCERKKNRFCRLRVKHQRAYFTKTEYQPIMNLRNETPWTIFPTQDCQFLTKVEIFFSENYAKVLRLARTSKSYISIPTKRSLRDVSILKKKCYRTNMIFIVKQRNCHLNNLENRNRDCYHYTPMEKFLELVLRESVTPVPLIKCCVSFIPRVMMGFDRCLSSRWLEFDGFCGRLTLISDYAKKWRWS